jgi:hypothetical protein
VRINKSWQQRGIAKIYHFRVARQFRASTNANDLAIANHHQSRSDYGVAFRRTDAPLSAHTTSTASSAEQTPATTSHAQHQQNHNPANHCHPPLIT